MTTGEVEESLTQQYVDYDVHNRAKMLITEQKTSVQLSCGN